MFLTRGKMMQDIMVSLGRRIMAEELIFEDVTTGPSQDIPSGNKTARAMVTRYVHVRPDRRWLSHEMTVRFILAVIWATRTAMVSVASAINKEVKRID